jgi:long-chain acyl-CoA synthetase
MLDREDEGTQRQPEVPEKPPEANLLALVAQIAEVPRHEVTPQSALGLDLGLDSLSVVELLCLIEEEMGISVDEGCLPAHATVADLQAVLAEAQKAEAPATFSQWPMGRMARTGRIFVQRVLLDPFLPLVCSIEARGLERLEGLSEPVLFSANHSSHLDTLVILRTLPGRYRWRVAVAAAADYWFANPLLGNLTALPFNSFPMARRGNVRASMEHAVDVIDRGWSVIIYPEGTRSLTGEMGPFKLGVGLLAVELGLPVVPIHLRGTYEILPKGSSMPRRGPVEVTIGAPMHFPPRMSHMDAAQQLEREIRRLSALWDHYTAAGRNW